MGWGLRVAAVLVVLAAAGLVAAGWINERIEAPGPLDHEATVIIPRGGGIEAVTILLAEAGVIDQPALFALAAKFYGNAREMKAGEYAFPAGIGMAGILDQMRHGRTVIHRLTVPEGLTSAQVMALLSREPALTGTPASRPKEGALLPETYHFSYGDSRDQLVERMRQAMKQALDEAWKQRGPQSPLRTPEEAVTLASIIERETALPGERARVAGVYLNRLEAGMKLQSDPTVIYAVTDGKGELGHALTKSELRVESPYNTYAVAGLPPGPIANPGRASLIAALRPERHEFLYFVADGGGGHAFAKTLPDHNRNVQRWRDIQRRGAVGEGGVGATDREALPVELR